MDEHKLDGNAAAGLLREVFAHEMTTAEVACANCGAIWRIGQATVYGHEMGTILRCLSCDHALVRVARGAERYWVDLKGVEYLQIEETAAS
jgi:ribosomal protein S27E